MKMKKNWLPKIGLSILPFVKTPFIVMYNLTERCNLRCAYCFGQYYGQTGELTFPQIKKILQEFYQLGARRLGLSGGEPLLHQDVDKVILEAVSLGYEVGLNSNGILVPNHLQSLRLLKNLSISLDGASAKIHDQNRGKGSFKKAMAGIEAAAKAEIPLHLCCTLTETNLEEWPKILELGKKYRAQVQISPLYPQFVSRKKIKFSQSFEKKMKKTLAAILKEKKKKGNNIFYSAETYRLMLDWPDYQKDISPKREAGHPLCLAGRKMVFVNSQGYLFPCQRLTESISGQNCLKLGVKEAYYRLPQPPCQSCRWACYLEYNSLLNLKLSTILNFLAHH